MSHPKFAKRRSRVYQRPTAAQVAAMRAAIGITPTAAADWLCVPYRTWRGWEVGEYPMPAGMWRLLGLYSAARHAAAQREIAGQDKPT